MHMNKALLLIRCFYVNYLTESRPGPSYGVGDVWSAEEEFLNSFIDLIYPLWSDSSSGKQRRMQIYIQNSRLSRVHGVSQK